MSAIDKDPCACKLACHIVKQQFHDICETACRTLLEKGISSAPELARGSGLRFAQLHSALLVLIQHNYVNCYLQSEDANPRRPPISIPLYEADLPAILQSLRKPSLLVHIRDESLGPASTTPGEEFTAGEVNEVIMQSLLEQGRLRLDQLINSVANKLDKPVDQMRDLLQRHFFGLVKSRYIERAPGCAEPPPVPFQHKKGARKSAPKPGSIEEAREQANQSRKLSRAAYEKERFKLPAHLVLAAKREQGAPEPAKKKRRMGGSTATNEPSKEEDDKDSLVLWRANREEFNKRLRHAACIDMVQQKNGPDCAAVLKAMLHATISYETESKAEQSQAVSQEAVASYAKELQDMDPEYRPPADIPAALRELAEDGLQPISYTGEGPGGSLYCVNMQTIIRRKRLLEMEAVIRQRFGAHGLRVFRLLLLHPQLEQKQIAEKAMLPPKEAKELLYRLFKAGFVGLQDVPRTADHAPSRTLYTWSVNNEAAADKLAAELYKAAFNVYVRCTHEFEQHKEIFDMCKDNNIPETLQRTHGKIIGQVIRSTQMLDSALFRLDSQIAALNDF
ncbi:hypothetical protein ABBQ38_002018 [Trebouxia sp. C0009 RCD-2024]